MADVINFPAIPDFKLGVDEPIVLMASAESGAKVNYEVKTGAALVDLVEKELSPKAIGSVTIEAIVPASGENPEVREEVSFEVIEGGYYDRAAAISKIRKGLDYDTQSLTKIAKTSISEISELKFVRLQNAVEVTVNGTTYSGISKRFVDKFIQSATDFWTQEITAEETRLAGLRSELKTIDPV